jgi:hypothetical protein
LIVLTIFHKGFPGISVALVNLAPELLFIRIMLRQIRRDQNPAGR